MIIFVLYVAAVPVLLVGAAVLSYRLPGKLRAVRAVGLATVYLAVETMVVVASLLLWLASGAGWKLRSQPFQSAHYWLLALALRVLVGAGRRLFTLEIAREHIDSTVGPMTAWPAEPLVVMCRHAGPADSLLLLNDVLSRHGRRPRIVAKAALQLDPAFDILLNRLPNGFISNRPGESGSAIVAIEQLASDMAPGDALVIFPEGGNFTQSRRIRAIDRLRRDGYAAAAERAERLRNVLPPRPAGVRAAWAARPGAGGVFVAHTGLDAIATPGDLWLALPENKVLDLATYVVPSEQIPPTKDEQDDMLYAAWDAIDQWIAGAGPAPTKPK